MEFEYDEIRLMHRRIGDIEYRFGEVISYSLLEILNDLSVNGWELVGEVQGKIIVKKLVTE